MIQTFGDLIGIFADTAASVREDEFRAALSSARDYLSTNFKITKVERLSESVRSGRPHLVCSGFDSTDRYEPYPVRTDESEPYGLNSFALIKGSPIWVVASDEDGQNATLHEGCQYEDLWSGYSGAELPGYVRLHGLDGKPRPSSKVKTLISVPIVSDNRTTEVVYFESLEHLAEPSDQAQKELMRIAYSLAALYGRSLENRNRHASTANALDELRRASSQKHDWEKTPMLFLAYPSEGERDVLGIMKEVVEKAKAKDEILVEDWKANSQDGDIPSHVRQKISEATFFVCYLSEPDGDSYRDNPNVLFEAGMFHGRNGPVRWVPIRESTLAMPFDFYGINAVIVNRVDGGLIEERLEGVLEKRLDTMLKSHLNHKGSFGIGRV